MKRILRAFPCSIRPTSPARIQDFHFTNRSVEFGPPKSGKISYKKKNHTGEESTGQNIETILGKSSEKNSSQNLRFFGHFGGIPSRAVWTPGPSSQAPDAGNSIFHLGMLELNTETRAKEKLLNSHGETSINFLPNIFVLRLLAKILKTRNNPIAFMGLVYLAILE